MRRASSAGSATRSCFRSLLGEHQEARICLERAREILEPFVDEIAVERIDRELKQLDDDMLGDSATRAG